MSFYCSGYCRLPVFKSRTNKKHIPTCGLRENINPFHSGYQYISTLANNDDSDVSATDTTGIFGQILNYIVY